MAYISATTEFQQIIFILTSDECFSAIKMGGDFSPELPFNRACIHVVYCLAAVRYELVLQ